MRWSRALGLVFALVAATAPSAHASGSASLTLRFTTKRPGSATGLSLDIVFGRAGDRGAKPPALRSAVVRGPAGLTFNSSVVVECAASDAELRVFGSDACPSASQLTVGTLTGVTGFGSPIDPLVGDDHVFNGRNQLIEVITAPGTPASPAFDRLEIAGSTLTAHPPALPGGPPDGETAIRSIEFRIPVRTAGGRSLITTPPRCPTAREWRTTGTFYFADHSVATAVARSPCRPSRG